MQPQLALMPIENSHQMFKTNDIKIQLTADISKPVIHLNFKYMLKTPQYLSNNNSMAETNAVSLFFCCWTPSHLKFLRRNWLRE